jgi:hypothetical protein
MADGGRWVWQPDRSARAPSRGRAQRGRGYQQGPQQQNPPQRPNLIHPSGSNKDQVCHQGLVIRLIPMIVHK